jgi:hypothetical protein
VVGAGPALAAFRGGRGRAIVRGPGTSDMPTAACGGELTEIAGIRIQTPASTDPSGGIPVVGLLPSDPWRRLASC